ncbi:MAG: LacI family DNA-binding transcriptional regulator [Sphaerochaeta sp.]|jgi:LacI family transcriptional regulator|uniref:LacI family DNA-binding transcriptional regulator n=1 Tax=Sphaerochaeta sp. TaxID=1972642 RepID=UPI002FC8A5FC
MGLTQKEIAKQLGISYMTVSRALNNTGYVSKQLKQKILAYAEQTGYEPHRASQVLVRNTTRTIALFSSTLPVYFWDEIGKGVNVAAKQLKPFNYEVHYHRIPERDTQTYLAKLEEELQNGVDAIGLVNQRKYDMQAILNRIEQAKIPFVTFNIDAPQSNRLCYVGCDYAAGGRLAADFIARALQLSPKKEVLVLQCYEEDQTISEHPNINKMRMEGFLDLMNRSFPDITVHVQYFDTKLQVGYQDSQIKDLVQAYQPKVQAMYLIPAFNTEFLKALETVDTSALITVVHDLDHAATRHLKTRVLSAVIDQSPTLQGYYTVMALERTIESAQPKHLAQLSIDHNLILSENRSLIQGLLAAKLFS